MIIDFLNQNQTLNSQEALKWLTIEATAIKHEKLENKAQQSISQIENSME